MRFPIFFILLLALYSCNQGAPTQEQKQESPQIQIPEINTTTIEGEAYKTFEIKGTIWLAENLNLKTQDSWCYEDQGANCAVNGRLYRQAAAKDACTQLAEGWRLPSVEDYEKLGEALGGYYDWLNDKTIGDPVNSNKILNTLGFTLSGFRGSGGGFENLDKTGFYWTSSTSDDTQAWMFQTGKSGTKFTKRPAVNKMGMSCRCVR